MDTGSNVSIIQPGISSSDVRVTDARPYGVTGEVLDIKGRQTVSFRLNGREFKHTFLVCSLPTEAAGIVKTLHDASRRHDRFPLLQIVA